MPMPKQPAVGLAAPLALAQRIAADRVDRLLQGLRIIAGIEMALGDVVERHLLRPHQAAHAQLRGLDAEVARERVERHLEREADAGARDAAIGQDRRLVGRDRIGAAAIMRKIVEARKDAADLPGLEAGRERIGGIGAGIDRRLAVEPEEAAVVVGVSGQPVMVLAAVGAGGEAFAPVLDPAQRMAELSAAQASATSSPSRTPL